MPDPWPMETIELGDFTLIRWDDEWQLWCGCGDIINLRNVVHGHCANCHVVCDPETKGPL